MSLFDIFKGKKDNTDKRSKDEIRPKKTDADDFWKDMVERVQNGESLCPTIVRLISSDNKLLFYAGKAEKLNKIILYDYRIQARVFLPYNFPITPISINGYITTTEGKLVLCPEFRLHLDTENEIVTEYNEETVILLVDLHKYLNKYFPITVEEEDFFILNNINGQDEMLSIKYICKEERDA